MIATFPRYVDSSNCEMLWITKHMMILELNNVS